MNPKIKNTIIFVSIAVVIILLYVFFIKKDGEVPALVSSSGEAATPSSSDEQNQSFVLAQDFLALLLSVKSISLNDSILRDPAFDSLVDSSILLIPDGTEGRPNPFAPFGYDSQI